MDHTSTLRSKKEGFDSVRTRTTNSRIEDLESSVGSIKENQISIQGTLEKLVMEIAKFGRQQDEFNSRLDRLDSTHSPSDDEAPTSGGARRKTDDKHDTSRFLAVKGRKLEIPSFDGTDLDGWILRAERYFALNKLNQEERIDVSFIAFEGDALNWFQWENKRRPITKWEDLKSLLLRQLRSLASGSLCEQFLAVKQIFLSQFINGLDVVIKAELHLLNPSTLGEAMEMASKIELKNKLIGRDKATFINKNSNVNFGSNVEGKASSANSSSPVGKTGAEFRRLSQEEDEREEYNNLEEEESALNTTEIGQKVEVHLNSVVGISNPKTMKSVGAIGVQRVVVLIDSGATHNFISKELVKQQRVKVEDTNECTITLGSGIEELGRGICRGVSILLQGLDVKDDFLPIQLGNSDVILGIQWLETLGTISHNWKTQVMKFSCGGRPTLRGDPALGRSMLSLKAMGKLIHQEGHGVLIELGTCSAVEEGVEVKNEELDGLLEEFENVFHMPTRLPPERGREHGIVLKEGSGTINVRPYRYAHYQKDEIEKLAKEMLDAGVIQPSNSPFSSPVLLVKKKDGNWRFCIDYQSLNKATIVDKFPIPVIDELLDELHGARVFSELDLKSGYHQIRMKGEDVPKIAFRTHQGHYEFLVMPFGLVNAPATFKGPMNEVFKSFLRKFILVFFDDILVYSRSIEEHKEHLKRVLEVLSQHRLYANKKKCEFGCKKLGYLGHMISGNGVEVDQAKVKAVMDWVITKNVTELRGFLGLSGYYRKFIRGYGTIARPLTDLLKKNQFKWSEEATQAFVELKKRLSSTPVLRLPDFTKEFVVETDASGFGLGAVLMQEEQPIAFFSQALSTRARQKPVYEKELMAIVMAVKKWRPYKFTVRSDQQSLKFLLEQRVVEPEYQRWVSKLLGYDFTIIYKPGSSNLAADALSRRVEPIECMSIGGPQWRDWEELKKEVSEDDFLNRIKKDLVSGETEHKGFEVQQDLLLYKGRLVIPRTSKIIPLIFDEFHGSPIGGHAGEDRTYQIIAAELFWMGMRKDIADLVKKCEICQRNKSLSGSPAGLLQPLALPNKVWDEVSMDFIEGLPRSNGMSTIFVVVDRLSKYAHFIGLKHPYTALSVAAVFVDEIIRLHGVPQSVVSDRDKVFLSAFWKELFRLQGTKLKFCTAYHPQSDGQTEVVNKCLEQYLRCWVSDRPKNWSKWLSWAELSYNTAYHSSLKCSPFRVLIMFEHRGHTANPGRRFLSCPNYGSSKKCNMFQFVDDELPDQYYKELVYQLHLQASRFGNENQFQDHEDTQNELLKIMEDLSITKSKIKVYDRLLMCLVVVVMSLVVAIAAIVV
ncbi:hypothetical protein OSB04_018925 [Centaurea solstitialis]|uniref:Ty3/gypsy retrotransposon protein n=1 Tax=Centaurea solstitialis TaxID=347529 RepID=A0AA38W2C9_9ASTR|nr:hypothetical protein OSB04_018925 [Centaurea solstitialis]